LFLRKEQLNARSSQSNNSLARAREGAQISAGG
jgi:hypothetical protein